MENTNPQSFKDVKLFVGDNFYTATDASYKNLIWENIGGGEIGESSKSNHYDYFTMLLVRHFK